MPQSLHSNYAHLVFATKNREPLITGNIAAKIYSYMAGIVKIQGAFSVPINGMPDHVHLLIKSSKNVSDANFMKELKGGSSSWINENKLVRGRFKWQAGYGWFSVVQRTPMKLFPIFKIRPNITRRQPFKTSFEDF